MAVAITPRRPTPLTTRPHHNATTPPHGQITPTTPRHETPTPPRHHAPPHWQVNRCINEDRVQLPADLASHRLDPAALRAAMGPRRDPAAAAIGRAGVDACVLSDGRGGGEGGGGALAAAAGSGVRFSWDESLQLVAEELPEVHWGAARGGPGPCVEQVGRGPAAPERGAAGGHGRRRGRGRGFWAGAWLPGGVRHRCRLGALAQALAPLAVLNPHAAQHHGHRFLIPPNSP